MTYLAISEDFADSQGRLSNYDAYDLAQRNAIADQRHIDVRSFLQSDPAATSLTMTDLAALTMDELSSYSMSALTTAFSAAEAWTLGTGSGTVTVGAQSDRNHWNGLTFTFASGANSVSSITDPIDMLTGFVSQDLVSLAFPAFPLAKLTLGSCFVDFTSEPLGNFTIGPTASVAFNSGSLVTPLVSGDTEMRFPRSLLSAIDLSNVTGVRFRIQATAAASTTPFRCLAIRLLAQTWVYAPVDINTRYEQLVKPVTLNGSATATSGFPAATAPVTPTDFPTLFRATVPSSDDDPRPIDASLGVPFYTGSMSGTNTFMLHLREIPLDDLTQLDLDTDGSTVVTQATLDALGRQPDYGLGLYDARRQRDLDGLTMDDLDGNPQGSLERIASYTSAAWLEVKLDWGSTGSTLSITDANEVGYSAAPTLTASTYYFLLCELEDTVLRVRILGADARGVIDWTNVVYDSTEIHDDGLLRRRSGRIGWYAQLGDGDATISNVRTRHLGFGEYRTPALKSLTPVIGAQLAVESTPSAQLVTVIAPGPHGANLTIDSVKSRSGNGWKITNPGLPSQGIITNPVTIADWDQITIEFDVLFPSAPSSTLSAYLLGEKGRQIAVDLPPTTPDRWQHVRVRPSQGVLAQTGDYALVLYQTGGDQATWYLDEVSITERVVAWSGRAAASDPWNDSPAEWMDFRDAVNSATHAALFPERGTNLQVLGKAVRQDAQITKVSAVPIYAQLGRLTFDAPLASTPVAAFTSSVASRTATFDGTGSSSTVNVIAWEWSFGDGTFTSGPKPRHTYAAAGTYTVTLTIHDAYDHLSAVTHTVTVA